jgi:alpha-glucoside transport system permease protein
MAARIGHLAARAPLNLFLLLVGILWLVPTIGLLVTSLLPAGEIAQQGWWNVVAHPSLATFDNYRELFRNDAIMSALWTTVQIAVGNTLLLVIVASLAGYAFAWLDFPGRDWLFVVVIGLLVVPLQVALIPIFSLYQSTGLFDTVAGLILFHVAFGLPFGIFLMRNFFVGIPRDILESARINSSC